jgi:hypothetical protein
VLKQGSPFVRTQGSPSNAEPAVPKFAASMRSPRASNSAGRPAPIDELPVQHDRDGKSARNARSGGSSAMSRPRRVLSTRLVLSIPVAVLADPD